MIVCGRDAARLERPLLSALDALDDLRLERLLLVEAMLWQCITDTTNTTREAAAASGEAGHPGDRVYPDRYYEILARDLGEETARWARLPYAERMRELAWYHAHFNTPDGLSPWPTELDGGVDRA